MRELALERNGMMDHRKFIIDTMSVILMRSRFYHLPRQNHWLLKFLGKGSLWYHWYLITLAKRWGGSQRIASRDGQAKLKKCFLLPLITGESACTAIVVVIADWLHSNQELMPTLSQWTSQQKVHRNRDWRGRKNLKMAVWWALKNFLFKLDFGWWSMMFSCKNKWSLARR